uniref:Reverse transcriptase domain-containing protein n=1 Tax=Tanacetum cinerariifolium TaxID=118510 RepID=A0A6L2K3P8_TANCI|nr:hypothetical protein [Tanacetum cinerariifolium]
MIKKSRLVLVEEDRVEEFIGENARRFDTNHRENRRQQPPFKRQNTGGQNVARAYMAGNIEKRDYGSTFPYCNRYKPHHKGQCTVRCHNCRRIGNLARDCMSVMAVTTQGTPGPNQNVVTCFDYGAQGHYQKNYPKVKNQNRGNKARVPDARCKAYVLGGGDANPNSNTVTGLLGDPFNIDLMPIDLGSFDLIIGMDWLAKNHAVIVCDEKIVRIPYENKILIVQRDKIDEKKSMLSIISCVKAHKYMEKGCQLFLAQVTMKENKDKSKEKRLEDVPTHQSFPGSLSQRGCNEDDDEELYRDVNINLEGRDVQMTDVHTTQVLEDTHVTLSPVNPDGQQQSSSVSSQFVTSMLNPNPDIGINFLFESTHRVNALISTAVVPLLVTAPTIPPPSIPIMLQVQKAPTPTPTTAPSSFLQDLLNFGSLFVFGHRLKTLEANFFEFMQTNQFAGAVSSISSIVDRYIDHQMNEAIKVAVQIQSDRLRDEAQAEDEYFLNKLDENIQKIIKEQVKVQVSKILPKIEKTVNKQLEAEVLTRSSNSSKTSYVMAVDLSELELKKILIEKMESNKSIHRSDEQMNLYKALVDAYECDKIILNTYGDTVMLKRHRDDADKDEEPSARLDRGPREEEKEKSQNTLTPELLAGPTYEMMKGSCKSLAELEFFLKEVYKFYGFAVNRESDRDVYSKRRIITVTELQIVEWHDYKHLDWITVHRDNDKLYKFKEGDFKRLRIQDIEDILLLLV